MRVLRLHSGSELLRFVHAAPDDARGVDLDGPDVPSCGPLPPAFMCPYGHAQYLYVPGVSPMPQQGYAYAPVVQAQPGASDHSLTKAFVQAVGKAVGEGANEAMFGGGQSW